MDIEQQTSSEVVLEEQNRKIMEKWSKIFPDDTQIDFDPPLLHEPINDTQLNKYIKEMDRFEKQNVTVIDHHIDYKNEYYDYKEEYGSTPKVYNKWIYFAWVLFLVILEIPTNYTTIEQFLHKPVVSMLVTIAVGSLLVFIAHSHGAFFKQFYFIRTTANAEDNHNVTSRGMRYAIMGAGFVGLAVIFYGLYYARLQYFNTISGVAADDPFGDGTGAALVTATIFTKVGILMLANVAIYALGVIGSYIVHDPIPGYQEAYFKTHKFTKKLHKEYLNMITELNRISKIVRKNVKAQRGKRGDADEK